MNAPEWAGRLRACGRIRPAHGPWFHQRLSEELNGVDYIMATFARSLPPYRERPGRCRAMCRWHLVSLLHAALSVTRDHQAFQGGAEFPCQ